MIGETISHYRILEKIGEGGMGEVYLAEDTSLKRKAALKFLHEYLQQDKVAQKRFLREAQSAAALDHPYICHIHEVGEADGKNFIAMEYVKGQTLQQRLVQDRIPLAEALRISTEVTEALEEAHQQGIIHRDLKPSNIMLTPKGHVKVMDFGLAKRLPEAGDVKDDITAALTREGTTLGTLAYMSPEQTRGQAADTRADIFSFGIVLYEMLTGVHPFRRETQVETVAAILNDQPPALSRYTEDTSDLLQHTLEKMLAKDPNQRYQSVHEVGTNLNKLSEKLSAPGVLPRLKGKASDPGTRRWPYWAAGAAILAVLAIALYSLLSPQPMPKVTDITPITQDAVLKWRGHLATDGRVIYYSTRPGGILHFVPVAGGDPVKIDPWPDQERISTVLDISADMSQLLVGSRRRGEGPYEARLWTISLPSYRAEPVGDFAAGHLNILYATWSPDGQQIAYTKALDPEGSDLYVVDSEGREPEKLLNVAGPAYLYGPPVWSQDGRRLRYTVSDHGKGRFFQGWEMELDGSEPRPLLSGFNDPPMEGAGQWTPDEEYGVFISGWDRETDLWVFREKTGFFSGGSDEPVRLTLGQQVRGFTFSPDGKKIYALLAGERGELYSYGTDLGRWVRYDFEPETSAVYVDFSKDGEWVAYVKYPEMSLWYCRRDGTRKKQIKFEQKRASWPRWSPDGKQIAYAVTDGRLTHVDKRVYVISVEGGPPKRVLEEEFSQYAHCWSPDGTKLLISGPSSDEVPINIVELSTREVEELPGSKGLELPEWSPDGRFIVAVERESNFDQQLVLFDTSSQSWERLENVDYFGFSRWSADGRHLYYHKDDKGQLYRIRIEDRKVEEVFNPGPIEIVRWEEWWTLDPEDHLLVLRNLDTMEIFALDFEAP